MQRLLKDTNDRLRSLENQVKEGFSSIRAHMVASHNDSNLIMRRLSDAEDDIDRLNRAQGLNQDDHDQ